MEKSDKTPDKNLLSNIEHWDLQTNYSCDPFLHVRHGAHLPHWQTKGCRGDYFITFRLADTLPGTVIEKYKVERKYLLSCINPGAPLTTLEKASFERLFSEKMDRYLDAGAGECWLKNPDIALMVRDSLCYFDGVRYRLLAWCVMPNHVHVVIRLFNGIELDSVTHSWKSFTATKANKILGRTGTFWQKESHDHMIRDEGELRHYIRYIMQNPESAGLSNWPWVGMCKDLIDVIS